MGHNLLIVDDSEVVRSEVWAALQPTGLFDKCLEAKDGIEGYKLLLNNPVSLVVCDVVMPGADGFKFLLLKRKAGSEKQQIPVIMLTSQSSVDSVVQTMNAGASDHVIKPFQSAELVAREDPLGIILESPGFGPGKVTAFFLESFSENVLASMADGLIVLDENEVVARINDAMLRYSAAFEDYVGKPIKDMVSIDDLVHLTGIESALQDKTVSHDDFLVSVSEKFLRGKCCQFEKCHRLK